MSTNRTTPAVYTVAEACAVARIGRSTLYKYIRIGDLRAIKIGSRTCVPIDELYRWLNAMPSSVSSVLRSSSGNAGRESSCAETRSPRSTENAPVINSGAARANQANVQP
jgi:excisionase family DNA binding protein